ncbi:hypothetical protein ABPG75_001452 [Micractinium tetrahymenae]
MAAQPAHLQPADAALDTTIDALPDELLGLVLAATGSEAWPAAALTSRRWHRVLFDEAPIAWEWGLGSPLVLPNDEVEPDSKAFVQGKMGVLERVGARVHSVYIFEPESWLPGLLRVHGLELAAAFALLNPAVLRSLHLEWEVPLRSAAAQLLGSFTQLTSLSLRADEQGVGQPAQAAEALRRLSSLERFSLRMAVVPAAILEATCTLPKLRSLSLEAYEFLQSGDAAALLCLTALQELSDLTVGECGRRGGALQPPPTALFPHLRRLNYSSPGWIEQGCLEVGGFILHSCLESLHFFECPAMTRLPGVLADATSLRSLRLRDGGSGPFALDDAAADLLLRLPHLTCLDLFPGKMPAGIAARLALERPELEIRESENAPVI